MTKWSGKMSKWCYEFNELPVEIRHTCTMFELETRIQQLELEKRQLIKDHQKSLKAIAYRIENCKKVLRDG